LRGNNTPAKAAMGFIRFMLIVVLLIRVELPAATAAGPSAPVKPMTLTYSTFK
jgi:hypothetical protein